MSAAGGALAKCMARLEGKHAKAAATLGGKWRRHPANGGGETQRRSKPTGGKSGEIDRWRRIDRHEINDVDANQSNGRPASRRN